MSLHDTFAVCHVCILDLWDHNHYDEDIAVLNGATHPNPSILLASLSLSYQQLLSLFHPSQQYKVFMVVFVVVYCYR